MHFFDSMINLNECSSSICINNFLPKLRVLLLTDNFWGLFFIFCGNKSKSFFPPQLHSNPLIKWAHNILLLSYFQPVLSIRKFSLDIKATQKIAKLALKMGQSCSLPDRWCTCSLSCSSFLGNNQSIKKSKRNTFIANSVFSYYWNLNMFLL